MTPEEYAHIVRAVVWQASKYIAGEQLEEVQELMEHGEPAEALCSLAWAIVNEQVCVPPSMIEAIGKYTAGLIDDEFMPTNLARFALPEASDQGTE